MAKNTIHNCIKTQGLVIAGSKGCGKTNTLMVLITQTKSINIVVDYASQHAFALADFEVKFMNKDYLFKPTPKIEHNIILDFSQTNKETATKILAKIIEKEYNNRVKAVIAGFRKGKTRAQILQYMPHQIYWIEESQDLLGKTSNPNLTKAYACGRNYKISFVFTTQRISELSTKFVERSGYLIGKTTGHNNLNKLSRILGIPRKQLKFIESLKKGEFVFYNGEKLERIEFPKFSGEGRSYEVRRELIFRKKKNLWERMKDSFSPKVSENLDEIDSDEEEQDFIPLEDF